MKNIHIFLLGFAMMVASCGGGKYATTERAYKKKAAEFAELYKESPVKSQLEQVIVPQKEWIASPNFGTRKPNYVILHHTAQNSTEQTIRTFHNTKVGVSSHYVIGRDGKVIQMVNDLYRAHHAGVSSWGNDADLNSSSIGIELDNNGTTDYWPDAQIEALIGLLHSLKETYKIPQANFIGHMDVAPGRKIDPARFPWKKLAEQGFGFWYDEYLETPPNNFDPKLALRIIGYDITNLDAAIKAFKVHYVQENTHTATLNAEELKILYSVFKKYL